MSPELNFEAAEVVDIKSLGPEADTIYLIGAVGTGKTDIAASVGTIFDTHILDGVS